MGKQRRATPRQSSAKRRSTRGRRGFPGWWYVPVAAIVVVGLGMAIAVAFQGSGGGPSSQDREAVQAAAAWLPSPLNTAPFATQEAYVYAVEHPEVLAYIPCYCGCGQHSGHTSNESCFVASRGPGDAVQVDFHGYSCDMCIQIARDAKRMVGEGKSLVEIRQATQRKFGSLGPSTNTPWPPGS